MRKIKNEDISKMLTEMRLIGLSFNAMSTFITIEAQRLGGKKGLSSERLRQIYCGQSALGAGSVLYEKAIEKAYRRLCK